MPGAESLALWSYAIYLAHKPIYKVVLEVLPMDPHGAPGIMLVIMAGIGGGWLLYRLVEQPFMRLRTFLFPPYTAGLKTKNENYGINASPPNQGSLR